ncbi:MAG: hypothetical protein WA231_05480 [Methylocella sp.]
MLVVHEPCIAAVGGFDGDDIVRALEIHNGLVGSGALHPQLFYPILQPSAGAPRGLIFGIELLRNICIGDCIDDPRGFYRIQGTKPNLDHISWRNAVHGAPAFESGERPVRQPCLGIYSAGSPKARHELEEETYQPAITTGEFGILGKA